MFSAKHVSEKVFVMGCVWKIKFLVLDLLQHLIMLGYCLNLRQFYHQVASELRRSINQKQISTTKLKSWIIYLLTPMFNLVRCRPDVALLISTVITPVRRLLKVWCLTLFLLLLLLLHHHKTGSQELKSWDQTHAPTSRVVCFFHHFVKTDICCMTTVNKQTVCVYLVSLLLYQCSRADLIGGRWSLSILCHDKVVQTAFQLLSSW